ncbi:glycerophosphodiester phosphodiesterase family protein [Actinoplanes sp. NPDC049265]|uniref:glycerophosphodiester phosphodiesterase family protein n=1 Tax=Actinoplanes sp. NPDC049265 TaxID=3363902 RepID=UPI00371E2502
MRSRRTWLIVAAVVVLLATGFVVHLTRPGDSPPGPWMARPFLSIAHQGGEGEAPSNTMYAFRRAAALGADMLEMDVHATADDVLVVMHDAEVDRTTDGHGAVRDKSLRDIQQLDAAFHSELRGIRTGDRPPPPGYSPDDFTVPSLEQVLTRFPQTPFTVEIKGENDDSFVRNARLLAALLQRLNRTRDIIVASFNDEAIAEFHRSAPSVGLAPGFNGVLRYLTLRIRPIDGTVALQIPVEFQGLDVATPTFIARAHSDGYAVHVWFSGTAAETEATYNSLIDACADGLMSSRPTTLEHLLDRRGIARPGTVGTAACPSAP